MALPIGWGSGLFCSGLETEGTGQRGACVPAELPESRNRCSPLLLVSGFVVVRDAKVVGSRITPTQVRRGRYNTGPCCACGQFTHVLSRRVTRMSCEGLARHAVATT